MARPRSPEKRQAILQAAVREIAESGLGASTASIAKGAGLAEGTMFTYFDSKDDLFNVLYLGLKTDVYQRIDAGFPHRSALRDRARHIWKEYLSWAMEKPQERTASVLLNLSPIVSAATRQQMSEARGAVAKTMNELSKRGAFKSLPPGFASSAMAAMQEAVMETAARKPRQKALLVEQAFDAFWRMAE